VTEMRRRPRSTAGITRPTRHLAEHRVDRVGYGATQLVESGPQRARDHAAAVALLRRTVELGVDHIDAAEFYGRASSTT